MKLVYKHEKPLFVISAIISAIVWAAVLAGTFGTLLLFLLIGYLLFLFAHSAFISYLQGTGVKLGAEQSPDIYNALLDICGELDIKKIPDVYLLRTDFFNALATRFLGRNFIVLFSDVVDALESQPDAIKFYLGHELGHIHRKHLLWHFFLFPASFLPILGAALKRAEEYTCDRYGVAACNNEESVKYALAAIAAGDTRWKTVNIDAYLKQVQMTNGFWMSYNEVTSDYPWLTKRVATALALARGQEISHPRRHRFAWVLAFFTPRFGMAGGMGSLMVVVAMIGILAAVALPAYKDYTTRAKVAAAATESQKQVTVVLAETQAVKLAVAKHLKTNGTYPTSLTELGYESETLVDPDGRYDTTLDSDGVIHVLMHKPEVVDGFSLDLIPVSSESDVEWHCKSRTMMDQFLPQECREP